jgi:hypothetical protein
LDDSTPDLSDFKKPLTSINEDSIFKVFNYDDEKDWNQEHQISAGSSSEKGITSIEGISESEMIDSFNLHEI